MDTRRDQFLSDGRSFKVSPFHAATIFDARGVRRFYLVPLLRGDELTDWFGWPRQLPHSIQDQRQARQECGAIRREFHKVSAG
jgi:hypothetical protein